jgi:uncharacterized protein (TIGR02118 family)
MWQFTVLYRRPDDPEAFDQHYREVHVPLTWKFPGLRRMTLAKPLPEDEAFNEIYMISTMYWDDLESLQAALKSPARAAAWEDANSFRQYQIGRYMSEVEDV